MTALFPERIETDRLLLERLSRETVDVLEFYRVCSRHEPGIDEVTRHLCWEPHTTPKDTVEFVRDAEQKWDDGEAATYVVRPGPGEDGAERSSAMGSSGQRPRDGPGEIVGGTGLTIDWERRTGRLGMWLRKPFWGRGYSGERAAALMAVAFERLVLELVAVAHHIGNENSRRAVEKYVERFGGSHDCLVRNGGVEDDGTIADQHRYSVSREEYRRATD
jgi:RimJ/RimL family protein N-acetyltransferase